MPSQPPRHIASIVAFNLKAARAASGMKQREVAAKLDTDVMTVSRWERGLHVPSNAMLLRLATVYGCDFGWFFTEKEKAA